MAKFIVSRMVLYTQTAEIKAESEEAAEKIVSDNQNGTADINWGDQQYSGTDYYEVVEEVTENSLGLDGYKE